MWVKNVGLDNKFRPTRYEDVAGQEVTKMILRHLVAGGAGLLQSYLFGGPWGSGKTTLARILGRALLCARPAGGDPCDACESCLALLSDHGSPDFVEVDAATRSGKADVLSILEDLRYDEHAGRRRVYLFDECFTEDTVLLVRDHAADPPRFRSIRDLVESRFSGEVWSFDLATRQQVWRPVTAWFDLGEREVVTLEFEGGVRLTVTPDQLLFTRNRGWVEARNLIGDDDIEESAFFSSGS